MKINALKSIIPAVTWHIPSQQLFDITLWLRKNARRISLHLLAWFLHFTINNLLIFYADFHRATPARTFFTYSLAAILFYTNTHLVVEPQVRRKRYIPILIYTFISLITYIYLRYILYYTFLPSIGYSNEYKAYNTLLTSFFPDSIWLALQYLLYSYGYWFALHNIKLERQRQQMKQALAELEQAKKEAELAFLRVQLNPHFIFNTLNFFYSEAMHTSSRLAEGIFELAIMMRSVMQLGNQAQVSIQHELAYVQHYIKLQKIRFGNQLNLKLTIDGEEFGDQIMFPPLILISLIENVFKYAELLDPNQPAQVRITLTENSLSYTGYNLKKESPAYTQGGVGMKNIERQLQLNYGARYTCNLTNDPTFYSVEIQVVFTTEPERQIIQILQHE